MLPHLQPRRASFLESWGGHRNSGASPFPKHRLGGQAPAGHCSVTLAGSALPEPPCSDPLTSLRDEALSFCECSAEPPLHCRLAGSSRGSVRQRLFSKSGEPSEGGVLNSCTQLLKRQFWWSVTFSFCSNVFKSNSWLLQHFFHPSVLLFRLPCCQTEECLRSCHQTPRVSFSCLLQRQRKWVSR